MAGGICHIICAGPCKQLIFTPATDDLVIAVDGGFAYCKQAGIQPQLFIGDLDSLPAEIEGNIACERIILPQDKDDTDTLYACKEGLKRGFRTFELYAALGGDTGHEIANMQTLAFLHTQDAKGTLNGNTQRIHLVTPQSSPATFNAPLDTRVSVFAFGGTAHGVYERGLNWELEDATLTPNMPLGVSNRTTQVCFEIAVKSGALLVVIG